MKTLTLSLVVTILLGLTTCKVTSQEQYEWTCFHGPDRTNKSTETGLLQKWPEGGPDLILTIGGLGEGFSSLSIADGLLYTAGSVNQQPSVYAFNLDGNLVWKKPVGNPWSTNASHARSYTGTRSTPTYDNGVIYFLGEMGLLIAFEAKTGREIWHVDLQKEYDARPTEYGYSESVLIEGNNLYVRPVGKKGHQVCLDKRNGKLIWTNTEIPGVEGYSSPVIRETGGYRQVIGASAICYYGVDTRTGKLLWTVDVINRQRCNIPDAKVHNNCVFITSGYGKGSMLFRLNLKGDNLIPEKVWETTLMDNHHGGVIFHEGYVYGAGSMSRGWHCLDFMTGEQKWRETNDEGSLTFAEGMLYALDQRGTMKLIKAIPEKFELCGEFDVPSGGKGNYWAHPVVCGKNLYIRHADKIFVYDIAR